METIGQYQLGERLGSGAFATVWLGYDPGFDGNVAIKVLGDNWVGHADIVRRFVDEARLLWRAEDPRVVRVFNLGELPTGQPWFAMEYADRGTLDDRLPIRFDSIEDAVGLIEEVARCVGALHRLGAVHRDVKPGNFLVRSIPRAVDAPTPGLAPDERLMIADLGLAKVLAESSGFTVAAGSPLYMAPEQASTSADVGFSTDVYALGVCAWEILTGQRAPGPADRDQSALKAATLTETNPLVPASVAHAIERATAWEPGDRWATAGDFADELRTARSTAGIAAPPLPVSPPDEAQDGPDGPAPSGPGDRTIPRWLVIATIATALVVAGVVAAVAVLGGDNVGDQPELAEGPTEVAQPEPVDEQPASTVIPLPSPGPTAPPEPVATATPEPVATTAASPSGTWPAWYQPPAGLEVVNTRTIGSTSDYRVSTRLNGLDHVSVCEDWWAQAEAAGFTPAPDRGCGDADNGRVFLDRSAGGSIFIQAVDAAVTGYDTLFSFDAIAMSIRS